MKYGEVKHREKSWASVSHIKNFIYLCKHELSFGLESI